MIKVTVPSFLVIGTDIQTGTKISEVVITYQHDYIGSEKQGYINSQAKAAGDIIFRDSEKDQIYTGYDITSALHTKYINELKALNPKVTFINTLA
jgi:hypothetical protein